MGSMEDQEQRVISLFEEVRGSVVGVHGSGEGESHGSGFWWDSEGHLVTNFHVVAGRDSILVRVEAEAETRELAAELVGEDRHRDVAVLRVRGLDPKPVRRRDVARRPLRVGQSVYAVGAPFGLEYSFSAGIISGLGRQIPSTETRRGRPMFNVIQSDAVVNPGSSGGPLMDSTGALIGMVTAIASPSGAFAGIAFAVPSTTIERVVQSILLTGKSPHAGLGVVLLSDQGARQLRIKEGAMVLGVRPGGTASLAGIRGAIATTRSYGHSREIQLSMGDVILAIDGKPVRRSLDLLQELDMREVRVFLSTNSVFFYFLFQPSDTYVFPGRSKRGNPSPATGRGPRSSCHGYTRGHRRCRRVTHGKGPTSFPSLRGRRGNNIFHATKTKVQPDPIES